MATSALDREDSFLDAHGTSLLEVIEDKNRTLNKKNLVHRIVYIGKIKEGVDGTELGNHNERLIKNLQNNFQTEPITGLMLIYMNHFVHVMEASSDMITETVRDVVQQQKGHQGYLDQSKILVVSHDVPTRMYQQWSFRLLDIQAARMEAYETSEGADKIIIDLLSQLMKLGHKIALTPKPSPDEEETASAKKKREQISMKSTLDSLHEKFPDLLPQQAHLHYLLEENDPTMMSVDEYLDMYEKPYDVVLESEMVWPLPTKLFPYN